MVEGSIWKETPPARSAARLTVSPAPMTAFTAWRVEADSSDAAWVISTVPARRVLGPPSRVRG
jgi:hypothetical protein